MDNKLLTQLRILKLTDSKPNFSELSRVYGIDRRTIKKYYDGYTGKPTHHDKPSKLDNYKELISRKLEIKGTTLRSVYEFLISEVDSSIGSYSNFAKYTKAHKLYPKKRISGHPRFETPPGRQAQVDWKEEVKIANKYGEIYTFQVFDYKLGHSRYCHFTYKTTKTRQDVFDCLIASFQAMMTDNDLISCLTVFTRTRKLQETLGDLFGDRELLLKKDYYCEGILYDLIMYNTIFPNGPEEQEKYPFEESERMCEEFSEIMFNDILCAKHKLALIKEIK